MFQSDISLAWVVAVSLLALASIVRLLRRASGYKTRSQGLPLPPGPPGLPIVGHLLEIPGGKDLPWKAYREYSRRYGKLISLASMGRRLMIIDDPKIAIELFEKRSAVYSSRAPSVITESCGWDWDLGFLPYGRKWRSRRRMFWQHFHPGVIDRYYPVQEDAARRLLVRVLSSSSEKLVDDIRYSLGEVLIRAAYGLQSTDTNDKYIALIEDAMTSMDLMVAPGTNTLDLFPLLTRVPTWLPGTSLLRRMKHYRTLTSQIRELPWVDSKEAISTGKASPSMATALIEELYHQQDDAQLEDTVKDVLAVAYAAGIDTTFVSTCAFFVAMSLHPDVQRKAQAELDAVIGDSRLPELTDREKLPYVNAVVKELQRWHVVTPLGVPHVNVEDDQYEGHFIPKGSLLMVNAWSMLHDEEMYPDPERFDPERYLENGIPKSSPIRDPATVAFGFGRRICPGRYFAETTLFIYIALALHTLDITPPVDEHGRPIQVEVKPSNDLISRLEDCRCTVKPRSMVAENLIRGASELASRTA
ncbi:cytochrome P450 [Daedaleopsis nitida]|nr:cytochrome P450 [Daedaleopsis nitida]